MGDGVGVWGEDFEGVAVEFVISGGLAVFGLGCGVSGAYLFRVFVRCVGGVENHAALRRLWPPAAFSFSLAISSWPSVCRLRPRIASCMSRWQLILRRVKTTVEGESLHFEIEPLLQQLRSETLKDSRTDPCHYPVIDQFGRVLIDLRKQCSDFDAGFGQRIECRLFLCAQV